MDDKEATRTCGQCHKEVAEANFALHETHCSRFLCLCPACDEAVPRDQLDQHREEQHAQVRCSKCNQAMERRHLEDHESYECVERLQTCQFCDLELPWKQLDQHCQVCGSRTELCRDCNLYVKLRDQPGHGLTCPAASNGSSPPNDDSSPPKTTSTPPDMTQSTVSCNRQRAPFPAEDTEDHKPKCVPLPLPAWDYWGEAEEEEEAREDGVDLFSGKMPTSWLSSTYKATSLSDRAHSGPWGDAGDPDQISTCPHCHLALPLFTLRWHEAKCKIYIQLK